MSLNTDNIYSLSRQSRIFCVLILVAVTYIFYFSAMDNFFVWDDFFWLYRARHFLSDPLQMFASENTYFKPVIYLLFWLNYKMAGLNHFFYHGTDIFLHAVNGILVACLTYKLGGKRLVSFLSALFFVTTFATFNAIAWTSARTDILCLLFSMISIHVYILFLAKRRRLLYLLSLITFVLALSAKGTALILPLILLLIVHHISKVKDHLSTLIPYFILSPLYLSFLRFSFNPLDSAGSIPFSFFDRVYNFLLGMAVLFFPQGVLLSHKYLIYLLPLIIVFALLTVKRRLVVLGTLAMLTGLLPLLYINSRYLLVGADSPDYYIIGSPSNRVYLASVGASIFMAALTGHMYNSLKGAHRPKMALFCIVAGLLTINYINIQVLERKIADAASSYQKFVVEMKTEVPSLKENSTIILMSQRYIGPSFVLPIIKIFYDQETINYHNMSSVPSDLPDDPALVNIGPPDGRTHVFATAIIGDELINLSNRYARLCLFAVKYKKARQEADRTNFRHEYKKAASSINNIVKMSALKESYSP